MGIKLTKGQGADHKVVPKVEAQSRVRFPRKYPQKKEDERRGLFPIQS